MAGLDLNLDPEIVDENRVVNILSRLGESYRSNVSRIMEAYGQELADEFIEGLRTKIENQAFNHTPLNPEYRQGKVNQRLDPRILIATHEYLDSFVAERDETAPAGTIQFRCGVRPGIHGPSGLRYSVLARVHEFGTSKVPSRPHWRPQAAEYRLRGREFAMTLRSRIAEAVRADLQE